MAGIIQRRNSEEAIEFIRSLVHFEQALPVLTVYSTLAPPEARGPTWQIVLDDIHALFQQVTARLIANMRQQCALMTPLRHYSLNSPELQIFLICLKPKLIPLMMQYLLQHQAWTRLLHCILHLRRVDLPISKG